MQTNNHLWKILVIALPVVWLAVFVIFLYPNWPIKAQATEKILGMFVKSVSSTPVVVPVVIPPRVKSEVKIAKGIYLTASSANNPKKMDEMIDLIDKTELNAVVIDIKDYTGYVLYDSQISIIKELKTKRVVLKNIPELITKLHEKNIYVIARQTIFQDPILAEKKSAWAIKNKQGGIWHDNKGLSWVDSARNEVWQYNTDIAKEVIELGFDEVNFDYVRFPTDGNMASAVIPGTAERNNVMANFFTFLSEQLKDEPAYISVDFFGLVMENHTGMSIGQKIDTASDSVDYISPMMYPSHYAVGHLGLSNPAASPGVVIDNGMKIGSPLFVGKRAQVRPWLQAFNIGAVYGAQNIRAQIDMVEKYPNAGWLLWNAANRYTTAGLKLEPKT
ncbi:MAG: putative glycoside hydrolase [Candidatus Magasanikbacteria bacterium]